MGDFGEKFRNAREKRGVSLDDVSNVIKISVRNLKAIEEQNFEQLPGGVFNKGFIRAYAKHVGLNEEEAVTEYLACLRQEELDKRTADAPSQGMPAVDRRQNTRDRRKAERRTPVSTPAPAPQNNAAAELPELHLPRAEDMRPKGPNYPGHWDVRVPWGLVAAASVVVVLGVVLWQRHVRGAHAQESAPSSAPVVSRSPSNNAAPAPLPISLPPAADASTSKSTNTPGSGQSTKTSATAPAPDKVSSIGSPGRVAVPAAQLNAATKPNPTMTLVIRATENSWVSVSADGQVVSQETLIAPAHTSVRASREIVAKIGNAAGIRFLWNGQEIPSDGGESEVKTYVFDASGMRVVPPTPAAGADR
ncbi:MAG TPA: RodZ domain-containing protein [Candidatus Sulfotelmatobacter sp.]|nr:RodZ domain-containing protein [Candidatus Sulfotelmatobacter sp.]